MKIIFMLFSLTFANFAYAQSDLDPEQFDAFEKQLIENEILNEKSQPKFPRVNNLRSGFTNTIVGPERSSYNPFNGYDYWRYVVNYNVVKVKDKAPEFPQLYEECHDDGPRFASYEKTITRSATISAKIGIEELGIGAELTQSVSITLNKGITATRGLEAIHTVNIISETWRGKIFLQTYNTSSGKVLWREVPYNNFLVTGVSPLVRVERQVVKSCN